MSDEISVMVSVNCGELNSFANTLKEVYDEKDLERVLLDNIAKFVELKVE